MKPGSVFMFFSDNNKNNVRFSMLLIFVLFCFVFSFEAGGVPIDDSFENNELLTEADEIDIQPDELLLKQKVSPLSLEQTAKTFLTAESNSLNQEKDEKLSNGDKVIIGGDENEYYLYEQEELDSQEPGLGIYKTLAPMMSSEAKKDIKKALSESEELREAIDFTKMKSETNELVLKKMPGEVTILNGKTLEEIENKNLPPGVFDKEEPDQTMVHELFDRFYELLKNAFLIIFGILILVKGISLFAKKLASGKENRKHRKSRRRKKHRKYSRKSIKA